MASSTTKTKKMQALVISLDDATGTARMEAMHTQCQDMGIECIKVPGVRGTKLSWKDLDQTASAACQWVCTPGMVGCGASHIQIWKRVVSENMKYALVLEDDAVLDPSFTKDTLHALAIVPKDYHVLLLGCFLCDASTQVTFSPRPTSELPPGLRRVSSFAGMHAYVISNAGARHLLRTSKGKVSWHIDAQINLIPDTNIYALDKDIAHQADMTKSSTASYGFPYSINAILSTIRTEKNIDIAYFLNTGLARIGPYNSSHIIMKPWHFIFVALGFINVPWTWLAIGAIVDIIGPWTGDASPLDITSFALAFMMGKIIRLTLWKSSNKS